MGEPTSTRKTILVTGATGKQGRAFISSILSSTSGSADQIFRILALTRNPLSPASKSLASLASGSKSEVELVKGDLDEPETVRSVFKSVEGGIWGVFAVLAFPGLGVSSEGEEKQGYAIADLSLEFGVSYFVYSSAEGGGDAPDQNSKPSHRVVKTKIEEHVKALEARGLQWTIIRPGFFMENFDGFIGKITVGVTRTGLQPKTTLGLIAVEDIGHIAAAVFRDPEKYSLKIVPAVGDVLTPQAQAEAYLKATGHPLPSIPKLLAKALLALNTHTRDLMTEMERVHRARSAMEGGAEQLAHETRQVYPEAMSFVQWAKKKRDDGAEAKRASGWNNVSILSLLTGRQ